MEEDEEPTYTLISKDGKSVYPNLLLEEITKSGFLKGLLELNPNNYEFELDFSPETVFTIGQFLKFDFLDSLISNYGHVIAAFDYLDLISYVVKKKFWQRHHTDLSKSFLVSPEKLIDYLDMNIDFPENFPNDYRNKLMKRLTDSRAYFFEYLKLSPSNDQIQAFIDSDFDEWEKINMNAFIEEVYALYKLMMRKTTLKRDGNESQDLFLEYLVYSLRNMKSKEFNNVYIAFDGNYNNEFIIKCWKIGSEKFPIIYYYLALKTLEIVSNPKKAKTSWRDGAEIELNADYVLLDYAKKHIEFMEKKIESCISCGKLAKFKTDEKRPVFLCSKLCYKK